MGKSGSRLKESDCCIGEEGIVLAALFFGNHRALQKVGKCLLILFLLLIKIC